MPEPFTAIVIASCAAGGVCLQAIGGVVWLVRLEGRVNTNEQLATRDREEVFKRLDRIENKLDAALKV